MRTMVRTGAGVLSPGWMSYAISCTSAPCQAASSSWPSTTMPSCSSGMRRPSAVVVSCARAAGARRSRAGTSRSACFIDSSVGRAFPSTDAGSGAGVGMTNGRGRRVRVRQRRPGGAKLAGPFRNRSFPMRKLLIVLSAAALLAATACSRDPARADAGAEPGATAAADPAADALSYAEPGKVTTTALALDLAVDFDQRRIAGTATYTLDWLDDEATELVLDTRDLTIESVEGEGADGSWQPLQYTLADADSLLGSKLTIEAPERNASIRVAYRTSPKASGLQWLTPAMTEGGKQPFM